MKSSEYELNSNRFSTHPCTELNHSGLINNAAGRIHHIFGHNIQQVRTSFQRNVLPVAPQGVDMTLRRKACHHTVLVLDAQMSQTPHERTTEQPASTAELPTLVTREHLRLGEVSTANCPRAPNALTSRCMSELKTSLVLFPFDPAA